MTAESERHATHTADDNPRNRDILIHFKGDLMPGAGAKVSIHDSGFMPGHRMWEGMRLDNGTWGLFAEHMDRLFEG